MFSAFNPSKWMDVGSRLCSARGLVPCSRVSCQSWTLPARAGIRTHNLGLPQVSSPTLYPLGHDCPQSYQMLVLVSEPFRVLFPGEGSIDPHRMFVE